MVRTVLATLALALLAGCSSSSDVVETEERDAIDTPAVEVEAIPNVSKTPTPGGPVPIPYPNRGSLVW